LCTFNFALPAQKSTDFLAVEELLNFQNVGGEAKLYQVRPLIKIIEKRRSGIGRS
jgi:hypothetical protein